MKEAKTMKKHTFPIILLFMTVLFSCQYKDFDEYAGTVPVTVVADNSKSGSDGIPAVTRCMFYSTDNTIEPFVCDLKDTATIELPSGTYTVFAYNNDSEINRTRAYKWTDGTPAIYTDKADYRGLFKTDSVDHTIYYDYPDKTYSWYGTATVSGLPGTFPGKVTLKMKRVTREVRVEITGIKHPEYIHGVRVSLDGVQREYTPGGTFAHVYVPVVADAEVQGTDTVSSVFHVYGVGNMGHSLTVHLDGGTFHKVLQFDVTTRVNDQRFGMNPITVRVHTGYDVKDDVPVSGSFTVGVGDWEDEPADVDL